MADQTQSENTLSPKKPHGKWRRAAAMVLITGLLVTAGVEVFAYGGPGFGHGGFGETDPEAAALRTEYMVKRMLLGVNATEAQQAKITEIAKAAISELRGIRQKRREVRIAAMEILSKPAIDRAALEALRVEQLKLIDAASQRLTQALADAAEVLTPEQRTALAERMKRFRARHEP